MKRVLHGVALLLAGVVSAAAADMPTPVPIYTKALPPPLVASWTGWYVGVNAGGVFGGDPTTVATVPGFVFPALAFTTPAGFAAATAANGVLGGNAGGFIGGGQFGYNWQLSSAFVTGFEADIQGVSDSHSANLTNNIQHPTFPGNFLFATMSTTKSLDYIGTVRGRLGWAATPTFLLYGTGGLAYGGVNSSASITGGLTPPTFVANNIWTSAATISNTRVGWTAGGGGEWKFASNWSAKFEYLYYDLGTVNYGLPPLLETGCGGLCFSLNPTASTRFNGSIVRAGLNYFF
jgi:outer membrane immunogenic protein